MFKQDKSTHNALTLERLGYSAEQCALIQRMKSSPGMVVVSGLVGSGMTTTLSAMVEQIQQDHSGVKIVTVGDPLEYEISGAKQFPHPSTEAMEREVMRLDPDVVLINDLGNIRAVPLAFSLVAIGVKVYITVQAESAADAYARIYDLARMHDLGIALSTLSTPAFVSGVIHHYRVRIPCKRCATKPGEDCAKCQHSKYQVYKGCAQVVVPDAEMLEILARGDFEALKAYWSRPEGA